MNQNPPRFPDAIEHYEAALKIKPDEEGTIYNYGVALLQTGKKTEAIEKFEQTLRINPNHKQTLGSLALIRAIDRDPALRNGEQAVRLAKKVVELTKEEDEWNIDTL